MRHGERFEQGSHAGLGGIGEALGGGIDIGALGGRCAFLQARGARQQAEAEEKIALGDGAVRFCALFVGGCGEGSEIHMGGEIGLAEVFEHGVEAVGFQGL